MYRERSAGHTGTLDPFATGLLVVLLGRATRVARFLEQQEKTYVATARLGASSDTDDLTGTIVPVGEVLPAATDVHRALQSFVGHSEQRPPTYSAKRIGGERSYRKARRGEDVVLAPAPVTVSQLEMLGMEGDDVVFRVTVSAGTYIRALARDLGERLGVGAYLTALRREAIGGLRVEKAVPLAALDASHSPHSLAEVLGHLPSVGIDRGQREDVRNGRAIEERASAEGFVVLLYDGQVVAIAKAEAGRLKPKVVLEVP